GLDLRDVELVVQWRHTKSLCMLWQHLGCAARDPSTEATGIYIVEPKFMDCHMQTKQKVCYELPYLPFSVFGLLYFYDTFP
ncbi:hypothetical protein EDB86DRAFT_2815529, partial [Lactarius hatsudake]